MTTGQTGHHHDWFRWHCLYHCITFWTSKLPEEKFSLRVCMHEDLLCLLFGLQADYFHAVLGPLELISTFSTSSEVTARNESKCKVTLWLHGVNAGSEVTARNESNVKWLCGCMVLMLGSWTPSVVRKWPGYQSRYRSSFPHEEWKIIPVIQGCPVRRRLPSSLMGSTVWPSSVSDISNHKV